MSYESFYFLYTAQNHFSWKFDNFFLKLELDLYVYTPRPHTALLMCLEKHSAGRISAIRN